MPHRILAISALTLLLAAGFNTNAQTQPQADLPVPAAPQLDATSYVLMEQKTGKILAASHPDKKVDPASVTKLMTLYVVFNSLKSGAIRMDEKITVSDKVWRMGGSQMFLRVGEKISVDKLIKGVVVVSGNDAAVALAELVGGTEKGFVNMMNAYARRLGLKHSHFTDASGLPHPDHFMSAHDIALLSRAIIQQFPKYYHKYFADKKMTWNNISQTNRNLLLWRDPSVDGLKTGHTKAAGYCLVTSAKRHRLRLIAVVMGSGSEQARANENQSLLEYGYHFFEGRTLYAAGSKLTDAKVYKGSNDSVAIGVKSPLYVVIPKGQASKLDARIKLPATIIAPVSDQQPIGKIKVTVGGKVLKTAPLFPLKSVPKGSLWTRLVDSVVLMFH